MSIVNCYNGMIDILFYTGLAINIIGDLLLAVLAFKYYFAFREAKNMPMRLSELKAKWISARKIAFGMIIGGVILSAIAAMIG